MNKTIVNFFAIVGVFVCLFFLGLLIGSIFQKPVANNIIKFDNVLSSENGSAPIGYIKTLSSNGTYGVRVICYKEHEYLFVNGQGSAITPIYESYNKLSECK